MSRRRDAAFRPHPWRRGLVLGGWLVCAAGLAVRAGQVQVVQAAQWRAIASGQHQEDQTVAAPRGTILDRDNMPLSVTRERTLVNVAPREVKDADATQSLLVEALGISPSRAARLVGSGRGWNRAGDFAPSVRDLVKGVPGLHPERTFQRDHPHGTLAQGVLGAVVDEEGRGGIEAVFDSWLRGAPGRQVVARDNVGNPIPGEQITVARPRAGGEVVLTLDMDLQEIAQQALLDAIDEHDARGGDIIITDPASGEILALFSTQDGRTGALSAVNTPFEPGSTLKPFSVAGLLQHGLASLDDTVDVGNGVWQVEGRTLHDTHTSGRMSIREALRESSNVGIAKAAGRMSTGVQYENLRDFGFGTLTGVELPGEVPGTLRRPAAWTAQSAASLAIGYEISVTPLQMAMAYGALANGGLLMRPRLVRELRDADGTVVETFEREVVRRVVDAEIAGEIGSALVDVVEDGTGKLARLGSFKVAGKSGTARLTSGGAYKSGEYSSSFVGYFPADAPQLVVFVKLDRPQGKYYGGAVAAPVTRATMEAALAANSLDLRELVGTVRREPTLPVQIFNPAFATRSIEPVRQPAPAESWSEQESEPDPSPDGRITVPDVAGLPARVAVRNLHRWGLRVTEAGWGEVVGTVPSPGTYVAPGDTIRLRYRGQAHD